MQNVTIEMLQDAYQHTTMFANNCAFTKAFHRDGARSVIPSTGYKCHNPQIDVLHELIRCLSNYPECPWIVNTGHCDGGVHQFSLMYRFYEMAVSVYSFHRMNYEGWVDTPEDLIEFLNALEHTICRDILKFSIDIKSHMEKKKYNFESSKG